MSEMTQVWERLYVGGRDDAEHLFFANPHRLTTVVSLCEVRVVRRAQGINYVHIPIEDESPITVGQFDAIIDAIAENVRWGTVLLHCAGGVSRAPIMTAAWMHAVGYKNIDAALVEIRRQRSAIDPSPILLASVKECL
jgi:protein-tyrosine phosphatase